MGSQLIHQENCEMSEHLLTEEIAPAVRSTGRAQRKYSIKDRKRLLKLYESRGGSQKQFAREQEIPISTLSYWVRRSAHESTAAPVSVVEIPVRKLRASAARPFLEEVASGCVEIRLPNQLELRVSAGTDARWVTELLRGLLTCSG
jgi:transposase-like protein